MSDRHNSAANCNPRNRTGVIYRQMMQEKLRREEEERAKKAQEVNAEFFREAEQQAVELGTGIIDFEELYPDAK